ncbi:hypothetical protein NKH10_29385 [Mesorhizobium sp. M1340]|uniref:hypothetical protein n=1 Tax=unclassified Mesorhizobium TaxID=325217 RepID=UPI00333D4CA9
MFDIQAFACTEFGGGTVGADNLAIYEAGVRDALIALGLVEGKTEYFTFGQQKSGPSTRNAV